ncbi:unnamed protein product [Jaminaea pallidilutea]
MIRNQLHAVLLLLISWHCVTVSQAHSSRRQSGFRQQPLTVPSICSQAQPAQDPLHLVSHYGHTSLRSSSFDETTAAIIGAEAMDKEDTSKPAPLPIPEAPPLICFESNRPPRVLKSDGTESTTLTLIERSFENSYYKPSTFQWSPRLLPEGFDDPKRWTGITLTQHGTSRGRQFDRLGSVFIGGVEVWRTDNPEPVRTTGGIVWTSDREVNTYYSLFSRNAQILFDYPNIVNEVYTGALNITLSITVTQPKSDASSAQQPLHLRTPLVYPISKNNATGDSKWLVDNEMATSQVSVPRHARAALIEVYASGTAEDEFHYTNVPDQLYERVVNASQALRPRGPYRELQVKIDGQLAGITLPYPVIFTGGINPLLWRPQVGFGAMIQPTYLFDVSPFLPVLADGKPHDISLGVVSAERNHSIPSGWFLSGNVQVALHSDETITTRGSMPTVTVTPLDGNINTTTSGSTISDVQADVSLIRPRALTVAGEIHLSSGHSYEIKVEHTLEYANQQHNANDGNQSSNAQQASGCQRSQHGEEKFLYNQYNFPLLVTTSVDGNTTTTKVDRSFEQHLELGQSATASWPEPSSQDTKTHQKTRSEIVVDAQGNFTSGLGQNHQVL